MKAHRVRFLVVPLLTMSLLALPCATFADPLQPGLPYEPKPGELPNRPPLRPPPLRPGFHPGDCSALGGILAQDTACKYNPAATAIFKANTAIAIGADGYVKQGTLTVDQDVFYANGKTVKLKAGSSAYFTVGLSPAYAYSGILAGDQVLDWAPNRSATWKDSKEIRFYPGQGWVVLGTLVYETSLLHDGSACCSSGSACAMTFSKDMEVACHVTGCDYPLPLGSCGACGTVGVSPSGACCCK